MTLDSSKPADNWKTVNERKETKKIDLFFWNTFKFRNSKKLWP